MRKLENDIRAIGLEPASKSDKLHITLKKGQFGASKPSPSEIAKLQGEISKNAVSLSQLEGQTIMLQGLTFGALDYSNQINPPIMSDWPQHKFSGPTSSVSPALPRQGLDKKMQTLYERYEKQVTQIMPQEIKVSAKNAVPFIQAFSYAYPGLAKGTNGYIVGLNLSTPKTGSSIITITDPMVAQIWNTWRRITEPQFTPQRIEVSDKDAVPIIQEFSRAYPGLAKDINGYIVGLNLSTPNPETGSSIITITDPMVAQTWNAWYKEPETHTAVPLKM